MVQAKLIDVAIAEFGSKGLDGASTRGIAAAAGTAMSSITYHYGGKEGLYLAAAEHIAKHMAEGLADVVDPSGAERVHPGEARAAIQHLLARFVEQMAGDAFDDRAMFIVREQTHPTAAFDKLYGGAMGRMLESLVDLVCVASGVKDRRVATVATITLYGQVLALRSSRAACLRLLGVDQLSGEVLGALKHRIAANTDAMLDRLAQEGENDE